MTPESNYRILPGVTRKIILDIAKNQGIHVREQPIEE